MTEAMATDQGEDIPVEQKTVKALTLVSLKRTFDLFAANHGQKVPIDEERCGALPAACWGASIWQ